jgi:hypothetical protein
MLDHFAEIDVVQRPPQEHDRDQDPGDGRGAESR